jgi:hypothetical protein
MPREPPEAFFLLSNFFEHSERSRKYQFKRQNSLDIKLLRKVMGFLAVLVFSILGVATQQIVKKKSMIS